MRYVLAEESKYSEHHTRLECKAEMAWQRAEGRSGPLNFLFRKQDADLLYDTWLAYVGHNKILHW